MRAARTAAALAFALSLAACGSMSEKMSTTMADNSLIGMSANAPARPEAPPAFPAIHDIPPPRTNTTLTSTEQRKMEDDLVSAREQLDGSAAKKAEKAEKAKKGGPKVIPAASSTIY